jgi:hypothetical protein
LTGLAAADLDLNKLDPARQRLDEGVALAGEVGDPAVHAAALEQLARLSSRDRAEHEARRLLDEAERIRLQYRRPRGALAQRDVERPHNPAEPEGSVPFRQGGEDRIERA